MKDYCSSIGLSHTMLKMAYFAYSIIMFVIFFSACSGFLHTSYDDVERGYGITSSIYFGLAVGMLLAFITTVFVAVDCYCYKLEIYFGALLSLWAVFIALCVLLGTIASINETGFLTAPFYLAGLAVATVGGTFANLVNFFGSMRLYMHLQERALPKDG